MIAIIALIATIAEPSDVIIGILIGLFTASIFYIIFHKKVEDLYEREKSLIRAAYEKEKLAMSDEVSSLRSTVSKLIPPAVNVLVAGNPATEAKAPAEVATTSNSVPTA